MSIIQNSEKIEGKWRHAILSSDATIQEAITNLDKVAIKIVIVANSDGELVGTVSDGDIRRGLLRGMLLTSPLTEIIHRTPLVVPPDMSSDLVMQLMIANKVFQIPAVNENNQVVGLHLWDELVVTPTRRNLMIIMAGGVGSRLKPYTETCPKPLLLVAGKPILEHIICSAKSEGFSEFVISINYLGYMIEDYFGDGEKLGVHIEYLREKSPLGTAGALGLIDTPPEEPFVVTNGDVITDIKYGELLDFHTRLKASATMAVRVHEWQNPFGVVETKGVEIIGFQEKPVSRSHINAGVYCLEPSVLELLEVNAHCDMPALFERLQSKKQRIVAYPMHEPWLDVGRPIDLEIARSEQIGKKV